MKEWIIGQLCLLIKAAYNYVGDDELLSEYVESWLDRMMKKGGKVDGKKI